MTTKERIDVRSTLTTLVKQFPISKTRILLLQFNVKIARFGKRRRKFLRFRNKFAHFTIAINAITHHHVSCGSFHDFCN